MEEHRGKIHPLLMILIVAIVTNVSWPSPSGVFEHMKYLYMLARLKGLEESSWEASRLCGGQGVLSPSQGTQRTLLDSLYSLLKTKTKKNNL